ncbi:cytochrome P450 monooxygenase [Xylariaceae sp. FL0255]|nr:cytochrome P450 monooxygenase [Xylariaceae sp. FL0255]
MAYDTVNAAVLPLVLVFLLVWLSNRSSTAKVEADWVNSKWLPRMFWTKHAHEYAEAGYAQISKKKDVPFKMTWWARENIFLPPKYLQDLKTADESSLSFLKNICDAFSLGYSVGDLYEGSPNIMIDVVRRKLNSNLLTVTPILADEAEFAISQEIGKCEEWKELNASDVIGRIMHRMTSRVLVAQEVCRDKKYLDVSLSFMNSVMVTALVAIMLPLGPFRGLFTRVLACFHKRRLQATVDIVQPIVEWRLRELETNPEASHPDAIQWAIELAGDDPAERNPRRITLNTLQNIWAASAGPAVSVTQMIYQVLMMPEYLEPLTREARQAVQEYGWSDKAMNQMVLLDSFIRECNRMYPLGSITGARTVMDKSFKFHDGLVLPRGTRVAFPIGAIQKDERFIDNASYFDGFRFASADVESSNKYSKAASTINVTNLVFGYGKHACPGRFYAIRKTKIIFAKIALSYEFDWATIPKARPKEFPAEGQFAANLSQRIKFKSL